MNGFRHHLSRIQEASVDTMHWNPSAFFNEHGETLGHLYKLCGYGQTAVDELMASDEFKDKLFAKFDELFRKEYILGIDKESGTQMYSDKYNEILHGVDRERMMNKRKEYKYNRDLAFQLDRHIINTYLSEFKSICDKYSGVIDKENVKNESGELVPVQAGEIIKLQKPAEDAFRNVITNNDGIVIGDCSVCGADSVICGDHICKTVLERFAPLQEKYESVGRRMVTKIEWFKSTIK